MAAASSILSPAIDATGVYTRRRLSIMLGLSVRTLHRMELAGELPTSFPLRGTDNSERAWMGHVLLEHFQRRQGDAIREAEEAGIGAR